MLWMTFEKYDAMYGECGLRKFLSLFFVEYKGFFWVLVPGERGGDKSSSVRGGGGDGTRGGFKLV